MKIKLQTVLVTGLLLLSHAALAGGGIWKMGPFGPYWDDNDWPEYTPMYWMEEFMNSIDDGDDIMQWMQQNQTQLPENNIGNFQGNPSNMSNNPTMNPFNGMGSSNPMGNAMANPMTGPMTSPMNNILGNPMKNRSNKAPIRPDFSNIPNLSQAEFKRMPRAYQIKYMQILNEMSRAYQAEAQAKQQGQQQTQQETEQFQQQAMPRQPKMRGDRRYIPRKRPKKSFGCFAG
ncbi:MAG: hypothetical protein V3V09_03340 [Arenicellales bacterium]